MTWKARFKFRILRFLGVFSRSVAGKESIQLDGLEEKCTGLGPPPHDSLILGEQHSRGGRFMSGANYLVIRVIYFLNFLN